MEDVVADIHKGSNLVDLCEILSEQTGPKMIATKFRAQEIENMNKALKFVFEGCGVQMNLKPSPENLLKGDEKDVSGLREKSLFFYGRKRKKKQREIETKRRRRKRREGGKKRQ